ncbi:MAG: carboxylating nicotinate-nucleotide diphosphorylase [Sphingomonadales bacterium]
MNLTAQQLGRLVDDMLAEDLGSGDVTAETVIPEAARLRAAIVAREPLVVAGLPIAIEVFKRLAPECVFDRACEDGDTVEAGAVILRVAGPARALLSAERPALNSLQHLSGIATLTAAYVRRIKGAGAVLLDTRKTIPGLRRLAKYATRIGGAQNHRMGLYDAILIKDNHIAIAGGVSAAVAAAKSGSSLPVEVECDTLSQVDDAVAAGADRLLLDNMGPAKLRQAMEIVAGRVPLEASGGINLDNIRAVAETGVDYISVGRITQSAPAMDIGLDYLDE